MRTNHPGEMDVVGVFCFLRVNLRVEGLVVLWSLHVQVGRQGLNEHRLHPARHRVRLRRPVEDVNDDDGDGDRDAHHSHGEEEVDADERDRARGRGDHLSDQEQEHDQGQQDRYTQSHLMGKKNDF